MFWHVFVLLIKQKNKKDFLNPVTKIKGYRLKKIKIENFKNKNYETSIKQHFGKPDHSGIKNSYNRNKRNRL